MQGIQNAKSVSKIKVWSNYHNEFDQAFALDTLFLFIISINYCPLTTFLAGMDLLSFLRENSPRRQNMSVRTEEINLIL